MIRARVSYFRIKSLFGQMSGQFPSVWVASMYELRWLAGYTGLDLLHWDFPQERVKRKA